MIKKSVYENRLFQISVGTIIIIYLLYLSNFKSNNGPIIFVFVTALLACLSSILCFYIQKRNFKESNYDFSKPLKVPEFYVQGLINLCDQLKDDSKKRRCYKQILFNLENSNPLSKFFHYVVTSDLKDLRERIVFYEGGDNRQRIPDSNNWKIKGYPKIQWLSDDRKLIYLFDLMADNNLIKVIGDRGMDRRYKILEEHFLGIDKNGESKNFNHRYLSSQASKMYESVKKKPKNADKIEKIITESKKYTYKFAVNDGESDSSGTKIKI